MEGRGQDEEKALENPVNSPDNSDSAAFIINLDTYSGPLDLLLHLIREHKMDIFDIPIAEITGKYLSYMKLIQDLDLDHAGDFLVMAATLAHIKSRMLLPKPEIEDEDGEETDPREELVRRLLEYQKFKDAASELEQRPRLGRDVFIRPPEKAEIKPESEASIEDVSVFQLIEVFQEVLDRVRLQAPHKVQVEPVAVEDKIRSVLKAIRGESRIEFASLFESSFSRPELIATFLAILELAKLRVLRLYQTPEGNTIYISLRPDAPDDETIIEGMKESGDEFDLEGPTEET